MTRAYIVLRDEGKTVCKVYLTADGYPSNLQKIVKGLTVREGVIQRNTFIKNLLCKLLESGILLPINSTAKGVDYWDYCYEIDEFNIKVVPAGHTEMVPTKSTLENFISTDFSDEWIEGKHMGEQK